MRAAQAAEILGLTPAQLMHIIHQDEIEVPKDGDRYAWTEAHLDQVRAAIEERRKRREEASGGGLSTRQAADLLGISYEELLALLREHQIPVPRPNPMQHYRFDEASLALVREALEIPPPPPRPRGLTTKQVATALGVSHEVLTNVMGRLRKELPLQKDGGHLIWPAEAISRVREALTQRHELKWMEEVKDHEMAVHWVASLAAALRRMAATAEKLEDLLARKPAETSILNALPESATHVLTAPVTVHLLPVAGKGFLASLPELSLFAEGKSRPDAFRLLRQKLWNRYRQVSADPDAFPEEWAVLRQIIVPRSPEE